VKGPWVGQGAGTNGQEEARRREPEVGQEEARRREPEVGQEEARGREPIGQGEARRRETIRHFIYFWNESASAHKSCIRVNCCSSHTSSARSSLRILVVSIPGVEFLRPSTIALQLTKI